MLTADTITEEQIEALKADGYEREDGKLVSICFVALNERGHAGSAARARCAEILNARAAKEPHCDFHDAHDVATDTPTGNRCGAPATHRIEWSDCRYSFGCADHLEIDASATVKPARIVPLAAKEPR